MEKKEISKRICISFKSNSEKICIYGDSIDELIEVLKELKNCSIIISFIKQFPKLSKEQWKELDESIITCGDISEIYKYLNERFKSNCKIENIQAYEDAIVASENAEYIYNFAEVVKEANVSKLQNAVIASDDAFFIYEFAKNIKGADIKKLEDAIIAGETADYIYYFASNIKGVDIKKLQDAIIATRDIYYIRNFARIKEVDLREFKKAIKATKDYKFIIECKGYF